MRSNDSRCGTRIGGIRWGLGLLCCTLLLAPSVRAQSETNYTWTGAGDGESWSDTNNWDLVAVPNGYWDRATFGSDPDNDKRAIIVDLAVDLHTLTISYSSGGAYRFDAANQGGFSFVNVPDSYSKIIHSSVHPTVMNVPIHLPEANNNYRLEDRAGELIFQQPVTIVSGRRFDLRGWRGNDPTRVMSEFGDFQLFKSGTGGVIYDIPAGIVLTNSHEISEAGNAAGTRYFWKEGAGTYIMQGGTKTYSSPTTVKEGRLDVNAVMTNTTFSVASNALLAGTGTAGAATVENDGRLGAGSGDTVAELMLASLVLAEDARLQLRLGATADAHDRLHVNGALTLDGWLDITDLGGLEEGVYTIITYDGTLTDLGLQIGNMPAGYSYQIDTDTSNEVNLTVIPEPGTLALLGLALGGLLLRRRLQA